MVQRKKEPVDLYTADRIPTGQTAFRGEAHPEGTYRMVVHVCIFNPRGEMLIQKRADRIARWPGYWDVSIGGGAAAGDTSRVTAQRETLEELGLQFDFTHVRPVLTVNFPDGFDDYYVISRDIDPETLVLQEDEVNGVRWADQTEILGMIDDGSFIPYQKGLISYLFFAVHGGSIWEFPGNTVKEKE